jgi:ADP-heptose:LPS heptosyltransferase
MPLSTHPQNILVIRSGALGDFILTTPVLLSLRSAFPDTTLTVAGHPDRIALVSDIVDHALDIDAADWAPLFSEKPDTSRLTKLISGMELIVSFLPDSDGAFTGNLRQICPGTVTSHFPHPPNDGSVHVIDHLLIAIDHLEINTTSAPRITPSVTTSELEKPYIVIHPGSGGKQKIWPTERYALIADAFTGTHKITITSGPADREISRELAERSPGARLLEPVSLTELAAVLSGADLYIGNDTGPSHLAAAVGTPALAIFGPTDPRIWGPRGERVAIVTSPEGVAPADRLLAVTVSQVIHASKCLISQKS